MSQLNPKLTPLPPYPANTDSALNWICDNRAALESIIAAQENNNDARPTNCACPACEPDGGWDTEAKLNQHHVWIDEMKERIDATNQKADKMLARVDAIDAATVRLSLREQEIKKRVDELHGRINDLYGWTAKSSDARHGIERRLDALEARLKAHESGTDEDGNPLPATFADRLRHVERQIFQLQSERPAVKQLREAIQANRKETLDSSTPATAEQAASKCARCEDTKLEHPTKSPGSSIRVSKLCSCLKVGDVVSAEVANMLPVGSQTRLHKSDNLNYWERRDSGWHCLSSMVSWDVNPLGKLDDINEVLRIGPAPVAPASVDIFVGGKKIEQPVTSPVVITGFDPLTNKATAVTAAAPPPDDICERWAKQIDFTGDRADAKELLRRLALPEMAAVCAEAETLRGHCGKRLDTLLDALKEKETSYGK